ncbi:hypothetical protein EBU58_12165 [bacterium]|nr:hypothetical protein [bacterium]
MAILRLKNGALGQILAATSMYPGQLRRLQVGGRDGTIEVVEEQLTSWQFRDEQESDAATRERFGGASSTSGGAAEATQRGSRASTRWT